MSQGRRERILDEAAQWMALLQSGHAGAEERLAFQQWRQADAEHGAVFDRLSLGLQSFRDEPLHGLRAEQLIGTLEAPSARRRFLQRSLALAAFGVATLALGRIGIVGFPWPGDLYTGTGQRQSFRLEDGSQLVLDARSRVRPEFDGYRRRLRLREGRLLVDVARDPARPFVVDTGRGQVEAQGTRFQVSDDGASSRVVVLESRVRITTADGRQCLLERGQSARFDASAILARGPAEGGESAWLDGRLEVRDRPLGEVLEALRAYRRGIISVADDAAALRVSGIYPLDDSGAALALLEQSLPIRLDYHGPYWVSIASR
ncbi:FecR family protein [Pseudomonas aeruginosa]|uniref:FecR family protein n=1 Tax=Pseudomonas aeruginosa TaxID=287 RepID=UPI000872C2FF|nr:FecR family protein [Pseudomonas aeruginosa]MCO1753249.1 FecR family protein [Pseudomonas aeruginosa]OFB85285.1 iron dicitrate transport regulator FecR [Pseudomonas aeruginosa]RPQ78785.1 iron dicitrate transport regulator FecR [Pseudomonas aeruginosa]